jgi:hypothetical protein
MLRHRRPPSQDWRTFLANRMGQLMAADFLVIPTATCRLLFVPIILAHDRRRVVHVAVTALPAATSTAQELRVAFPWHTAPHFLLHDCDHAFDGWAHTAKAIGVEELRSALAVARRIRRTFHGSNSTLYESFTKGLAQPSTSVLATRRSARIDSMVDGSGELFEALIAHRAR